MDKKAAVALESSIKHWGKNVAAETPDGVHYGSDSCALCKMFRPYLCWHECKGCPVSIRSGVMYCDKTPYSRANRMYVEWVNDPSNIFLRDQWREAAQAELDFLKSLREPKKGDKEETD